MADFDLTQTDAQVQSILNDAQDAMGAGAQTSLTTDYIMLKGTNGRYHKILKDSFTEAVRNTLAGLLVNNDKGTTISQIAAIASGDFGSVTPANLASVLGGVMTAITSNADLDNYKTQGTFICGSGSIAQTLSNCPVNTAFRLEVLYFSGVVWIQKLIAANGSIVFFRSYNSSWSSWNKYPSLETLLATSSDLSSLASALGNINGFYYIGDQTANSSGEITFQLPTSDSFFNNLYYIRIPSLSGRICLFGVRSEGVDKIFTSDGVNPTITKDAIARTITVSAGSIANMNVILTRL